METKVKPIQTKEEKLNAFFEKVFKDLIITFPEIKIKYLFLKDDDMHIIRITPRKTYKSYLMICTTNNVEDEFLDKFSPADIMFVTKKDLTDESFKDVPFINKEKYLK